MALASLAATLRRPSKGLESFQGLRVRSTILASVVLLVLACLPAWWHTTAIERRALPLDPLLDPTQDSFQAGWPTCFVRFPIRVQLVPLSEPSLDWVVVAQDAQDALRRAAFQAAEADRSAGGDGGAASCVQFDVVPASEAEQYVSPFEALTDSVPGTNATEKVPSGYVLDYRMGVAAQANQHPMTASNLSALLPLSSEVSAANAGAQVAAGVLDLFPLSCLSLAGGVCESDPAGEASNKAIQYMRSVEIVFSLVQEDTTQVPAEAQLDTNTQPVTGSPWDAPPEPKEDTHQYTSWSLAQVLDSAIGRAQANPRTPVVPGSKENQLSTGANKLAETLTALSQSGLHHFQLTTQMLFHAPLAFEPTLDEISWTNKEYVRVQRAVPIGKSDDDGFASISAPSEHDQATYAPVAEPIAEQIFASTQEDQLVQNGTAYELRWFMEEQEVNHTRTRSVVEPADLQTFVNAGAWSLGGSLPVALRSTTSDSSQPDADTVARTEEPQTLHMLYFVPSPRHRPLFIREANGVSPSHSWVIPQWGGVVLEQHPEMGVAVPLSNDRLDDALLLWDKQLRKLLGVPTTRQGTSPRFAPDLLALARVYENVRAARNTLRSTTRLIEQMQALGVDRNVHADFEAALSALHSASSSPALVGQSLRDLLRNAWDANYLATRSFLHPSMIAQLYFPDEHKYAIYTPLFAPAAVPLLVSLLRLLKAHKAVRKASQSHNKSQ